MPDRARAAYERTPRKAFKTVKQFDRLLGRSNLRNDHYESCKTFLKRALADESSDSGDDDYSGSESESEQEEDDDEDEQEDSDDVLCNVIATEGNALADGDETDASDN